MNYIITLFNKKQVQVTETELKSILSASDDKLVHISRLGIGINKKTIVCYQPQSTADLMEERKNNREGVLHDGSRAIKHFGVWYDPYGQLDEKGNPLSRYDERYYPEVARDCVPSPSEYYSKYEKINDPDKRLQMILASAGYDNRPRIDSGMQKIKYLLPPVTD